VNEREARYFGRNVSSDAYGLIVANEMSPEFKAGSTVCVHPHLGPRDRDPFMTDGVVGQNQNDEI